MMKRDLAFVADRLLKLHESQAGHIIIFQGVHLSMIGQLRSSKSSCIFAGSFGCIVSLQKVQPLGIRVSMNQQSP
jgi:hypothetical protein